jgi:hypothetical protein
MKPREASAMKDCAEELSDAVNELRKSLCFFLNFRIMLGELEFFTN